MKKILITGATGFIGNYVIRELLQTDNMVIASSSDRDTAKRAWWFGLTGYIPFNLKEFDNNIDYYAYFNNPDALIHLAWEGLPNYKERFHIEENLPGHYSFLKNIISHGLADVTITGTCFEYGMQEGCLSEEMDTKPANPYAVAKDTLRKSLQQLKAERNFSLKWVRLFYMYGKGQSPNSLLSQLDRALANQETVFNMSGGEQERDYLPVEKVAEYIVKIALQSEVTGIINCCSGMPVKIKAFVLEYLKQKNQYIELNLGYYPYADYEPMRFWGDTKKLKRTVNYE